MGGFGIPVLARLALKSFFLATGDYELPSELALHLNDKPHGWKKLEYLVCVS